MTDDIQILDSISTTADIGRDSLNHVIDKATQDYHGNNPAIRSLAEKLIQTEQANIEEMKTFL